MTDGTVGMVYPTRGHTGTRETKTEYGHPAHRGFARAIDALDIPLSTADWLPMETDTVVSDLLATAISDIPECDVFITENDSALYAAPRLSYQYPGASIIHLAAADRILGWEGPPTSATAEILHRQTVKKLDQSLIRRFLTEYCEGLLPFRTTSPVVSQGLPMNRSRFGPLTRTSSRTSTGRLEWLT